MKHYWTKIELEKSWSLSPGEMHYIEKKDNKLVYALKMKYFDIQGYFPKQGDDIPAVAIKHVAAQLSLLNQSSSQTHIKSYQWQSRISQLHNTEIREYYGFKKFETSNLSAVKEFIEKEEWLV